MARLIDTHAHLNSRQFREDLEQVLARARSAGVGMIINVGSDESDSERAVMQSEEYPQLWAAVGIHPHFAATVSPSFRNKLASLATNRRVLAIGEMGLDFYRELSPRHLQEEVFREQLELAAELKLSLIHIWHRSLWTQFLLCQLSLRVFSGFYPYGQGSEPFS